MAPYPILLPCALSFLPPSHQDATTSSPCWVPRFMTQERIMFSNPTPSKLRLSPAATISDDTLSALTPPLHCAPILQSANPPQVVLLSLRPSLLHFVSIVLLLLNDRNSIFEPACVFFPFPYLPSLFWQKLNLTSKFNSLFAIWSLSSQGFHYYFDPSTVSWQYQKYWTILMLVLCLLCVTPLVCWSYSSFAPSSTFFRSWWKKDDTYAMTSFPVI